MATSINILLWLVKATLALLVVAAFAWTIWTAIQIVLVAIYLITTLL